MLDALSFILMITDVVDQCSMVEKAPIKKSEDLDTSLAQLPEALPHHSTSLGPYNDLTDESVMGIFMYCCLSHNTQIYGQLLSVSVRTHIE
jgi:hypothetical protein